MSDIRDRITEIRKMRLGDIIHNPRNWRKHTDAQRKAFAGLLAEVGWAGVPLVYDSERTGGLTYVDGHMRKEENPDLVANVAMTDLDDGDADLLLASFDSLTGLAEFDTSAWDDLMSDTVAADASLQAMLDGMRERFGAGDEELDDGGEVGDAEAANVEDAENLRVKWQTELGQNWQLGNHTLFIGPAESAGIECDFAIFDPPFNWAWQQQENALSWGIWKTALVMGLAQCMPLAVRDDFWHWWVWDAGMNRFGGRGHRPVTGCAMMILLGEHSWHEEAGLVALDRHEIKHFDWPTQVVHIQDHLAGREYKHEKPYPLTDYILSLYSARGDVVGDLFAGSGAFLIACENLKRQYRGAELSPENAAVILDRWTRTFEVEPRCL